MALFKPRERTVAEAIAAIGYCNPFLPERVELERRALGKKFVGTSQVMNLPAGTSTETLFQNVSQMRSIAGSLADSVRERLQTGAQATESDLRTYEDVVLYLLYSLYMSDMDSLTATYQSGEKLDQPVSFWKGFMADFRHYLNLPGINLPSGHEAAHAFAVFFQIERAFSNIFGRILGSSLVIARLRAAVWESVFTQDMRRYSRALYFSMHRIPTLVLGASGTGKELVAQAIGHSQYIPFDSKRRKFGFEKQLATDFGIKLDEVFCVVNLTKTFRAVNLSALASTLFESELFGHRKGSFSGATKDRVGWLEECPPAGAVFLDEIGELDHAAQVKLLRVVQSRQFERVGDTGSREFCGKFIAATNRDLLNEILAGRFREDFYFRLCADQVHTPSLCEQLQEKPEDLEFLVRHVARSVVGDFPEEADRLAQDVYGWIQKDLGGDYSWPGNVRELEQCVRNIMIRKSYIPSSPIDKTQHLTGRQKLAQLVLEGKLTQKELVCHYASLAYAMDGTLEAAAQRLHVNWRTVRSNVRDELVDDYKS